MVELKPYPQYKDSGIEWIGEIPNNWKKSKIKYVLESLNYKRTPLSGEIRSKMKKVYDYYGASGVIDKVENYIFDETLILIGEDGANLYSRSSPLAFLATGKYWVNNHAHILRPRNGNIIYYVNLLETIDYTHYISGSAQPKLTQDALANIEILEPPVEVQNLIGSYIEKNNLDIDAIILTKQQLIKLLEEKRQAIITEAVTKGLDPNVKMKDSGIEWIGEIPERWEVVKIKRYLKVKNGREIEKELPIGNSEGIDVFGSGGVFKKTNKSLYEGESVLFGRKGTIGKPLYVNQAFWTVDTMYYTEFSKESYPKWFYYMFLIFPWEEHTTKTAIPSIVGSDIENEFFAIPTYEEQKLIVTYLTAKMDSIDCAIKNIKYQILKLNEYRESLIYEAVTGKIDLRDYEEETDES